MGWDDGVDGGWDVGSEEGSDEGSDEGRLGQGGRWGEVGDKEDWEIRGGGGWGMGDGLGWVN